jgi:hypothetical protein
MNVCWYRIWSDGWIEQGGWCDRGSFATLWNYTVTFLKPYTLGLRYVLVSASWLNGDLYGEHGEQPESVSDTGFVFYYYTGASADGCRAFFWYACGY